MFLYAKLITLTTKKIKIVQLDKIALVKQGLATGNNKAFFYKRKNENGPYVDVETKKEWVLKSQDIEKIQTNEKLRKKIINNGLSPEEFSGRYIVPIDKGGSSDIESGRLSNYFAPTGYFIDWSENSVKKLQTMTIADWKRKEGKNISKTEEKKKAAVLRNIDLYFRKGITFSPTGLYAPTYRQNSGAIFDHAGDCIFIKNEFKELFSEEYLLGILCSKFMRYVQKCFINNSVSMQVDDVKRIPIPICDDNTKNEIENYVKSIIEKQKQNLDYAYQHNEQKNIDDIVYGIFGISGSLIHEIENWYERKYPKLL